MALVASTDYIRISDIGSKFGDTRTLTIASAYSRKLSGFSGNLVDKTCVTFKELPNKVLVLSVAQSFGLIKQYTSDFNSWIGLRITLVLSTNTKGNLTVVPQIHINYLYDKVYAI